MFEASRNTVFLDDWIKAQASKYAYNEKTSGFIGKKCLKERVLSAVPREFIALGHTRERVGLRLSEMLSYDLTKTLIRDCDERRIKSTQPEPSIPANRPNLAAGDKGISTTGASATSTSSTATRGVDIYNPSLASTPGASTDASGTGTGVAAARTSLFGSQPGARGASVRDDAPDKGKTPVKAKTESESEVEDDGGMCEVVVFSALDGKSNQKFVPASPVSDVDRAIADFIENQLPNPSKARPKTTSKPAVADNPGDIFSRGGSSPQRSRSPESSLFVPVPPLPPLDPDIPFLPFKLQHRILITLQNTLEGACYDFARKHYPEFLVRKGWDCPEAGELTHWTRGLIAEFRESPARVVREPDHFPSTLKGIDEIRHSAVHRVPVSGRDIQRLIEKTKAVLHVLDSTRQMRDQIDEIDGIIEGNIQTVLDKRRKKEEKLRLELEKLEEWKRILELREVRAVKQAELEEENIQRSFRDDVGQALGALGFEENAADPAETGPDPESSNVSETQSEVGVENSIPGRDEEYFHESEGW